jgi:Ca2+-binding RTX toxin-like protein
MIMRSKCTRAALSLAGITASLAILGGAVLATGPSDHTGDPAVWGPPLEVLCDSPAAARAAGYNVIDDPVTGIQDGGLLEGTSGDDAIFANSGNDIVYAGRGNDLICGGYGFDTIHGEAGNDAAFGEEHNDTLRGGNNDDYLDGGGQNDQCDGGNGSDSADCETVAP